MDQNAAGEIEKPAAMANCLMILNADQNAVVTSAFGESDEEEFVFVSRKFECKTCNRKFSSFQALGGHCASHKKTKPPLSDDVKSPSEPKAHGCKICGADFPIGQALGGHMRRHREFLEGHDGNLNDATTTGKVEEIIDEKKLSIMSGVTAEGSSGSSDGDDGDVAGNKRKIYDGNGVVSVSKNSSSKRVCLDLSLWWNHEQLEEYVAAAATTATSAENDNKKINDDDDNNNEIEEGEIVEQHEEEEKDFLKLELRLPHQ